jgi:Glycosyl transferase family 2
MNELGWIALAAIAYTYLAYPLLASALARWRAFQPNLDLAFEPSMSVCVAVHNGADYIGRKLDGLLDLDYPAHKIDFWICSDGSTDATVEIVARYAARDARVHLLVEARRAGKPTALNRLWTEATSDVLFMTDVRQRVSRGAARALVRPLADPRVGCVSGRVVLDGLAGSGVYWRYESWIRRAEATAGKSVGVTGPIYAMRRHDAPALPADVILDDVWVPLGLALAGRRNVVADDAEAREDAFSDGREFNRKVRTLAGNYQLLARMPRALVPALSPVWFRMWSHKVLRLVSPFALAVLLVSSFEAQGPVWRAFAVAQLAFYALAAVGPVAGLPARVARTFVVLNAAAVVGLWRYALGLQRVTW